MLINADFSLRATVTPTDYRWVASPQPGVERVMLDRVGEEIARATSLVRYARNSSFPSHQHPGGEEILVIEGVFSDEQGDYPAGWYLRNPPGSSHSPRSRQGAVILVKLCQMHSEDSQSVRIDSSDPLNWNFVGGRVTCTLFSGNSEHVSMERLIEGQLLSIAPSGGNEVFILSGKLSMDGECYPAGSWLRLPTGSTPDICSLEPSLVFVKTGQVGALVAREALS